MSFPIFINKRIFWDTRLEEIDMQKHKNFVITRVFEYGHLNELRVLLKFYSHDEIVAGLKRQKYLSKITLQFASALFNIPKEDFECYTPKPYPRHAWPF